MSPSWTPYEPSETTAIDTRSPSADPWNQSRAASTVADAAEAADEEPRAAMMAAPRLATVGMKVFSSESWSPTASAASRPATSAWNRWGYWVAEWLPQMVIFVMSVTAAPVFAARERSRGCGRTGQRGEPLARDVRGVAYRDRALVFAGLP